MTPARTQDKQTDAIEPLRSVLDTIRPLVTMSRDELVVIALESGAALPTADYVTAAENGVHPAIQFQELDGGTVPTVEAVVGEKPVVILAGDTIVGGKQNRIINVTVWLPAKTSTPIPVSCLEAGRWDTGRVFQTGRNVDVHLRSMVSRMVTDDVLAMAATPSRRGERPRYAAAQGAVWDEIAQKEARAGRRSGTHALHDLYATEAMDVSKAVAAFPVPEGASGMAVAIGGRLVALDLFDATSTLGRQWPRLIESAASAKLDQARMVASGLAPKPQHRHPDPGALDGMLTRARAALPEATVSSSVGEGWDVRLAAAKVHGSALVHDGRVVHLALFRD